MVAEVKETGSVENVRQKVAERRAMLARVKNMIIKTLNLEMKDIEIEDDAILFGMGLGLDSIDALELACGVEEEFGVSIGEDQMEVFRSVNTLTDYLMQSRDDEHAVEE